MLWCITYYPLLKVRDAGELNVKHAPFVYSYIIVSYKY